MSPSRRRKIRTLIIDDHALFRESVARVFAAELDFDVLHCSSIRDALQILIDAPADVVLLDHDLGTESASHFIPAASQAGFTGRVLIVTAWISDTEARRFLRQGVSGIFLKEKPLSVLIESIRAVANGQTWIDERYAGLTGQEITPPRHGLKFTERQRKVLRFVVAGLPNKEIAWRLEISETYVKAILQSLFRKTGVRTRGQLVRVALEQYDEKA
jgi:two-component system nitrate/nitrite response regulator NarL